MTPQVCRCGKGAFFLRRQSGEALCRKCFIRSLERGVSRVIKKERLFTPEDRILVALSGGKDSVALAHVLSKIERPFGTEIFAVTIDEGVMGYREEGIGIAKRTAKEAGLDHHVVTFKDAYGYTLEEIVGMAQKKGIGLLGCSFCGILRRRLLNDTALRMGATKVATGHNLDDEAQTFIINILRGDVARIGRAGVKPIVQREGFVARVKPLRYIPEVEIAAYAYLKGYPLYEKECPYVRSSLRDEVRDMLNALESGHPGTKHAIVNGADKLSMMLQKLTEASSIDRCSHCGSPSSKEVCRMCEVLEMLGIKTTLINHLEE